MKLTDFTTIFIIMIIILSIAFVSEYMLGLHLIDWLFAKIVTWIGLLAN